MKKFVSLLLAGALMLSVSASALAATSVSPETASSAGGQSCISTATIDAYTTWVSSTVWIWTKDSKVLPSGYLGASSYVYDDAGNIKASTAMTYSDSATSGIGVYTKGFSSSSGSYYSWGQTKIYGPSTGTYSTATVISPRATVTVSRSGAVNANDDYEEVSQKLANEFSNALASNGMVKAVSIDGAEGWVYAQDVQVDEPQSLEEVLLQQEKTARSADVSFINVYAEDGTTVVGQFPIYSGSNYVIYK